MPKFFPILDPSGLGTKILLFLKLNMIAESSEPIKEGLSEDETEERLRGILRPLVEGVGVGRRKEERVGGS
jgi:hypothetical protein